MKWVAILFLFSVPGMAQVPIIQTTDKPQDVGYINNNFRNLSLTNKLSAGTVPPQYQQCLMSPLFCVNSYSKKILVQDTSIYFSTTTGSLNGICFPDGTCQTSAGVGSSAVSVNTAQLGGNGTLANPLTLLSSSVTLQGNTFNGISELLQADTAGKLRIANLPADGYSGTYVHSSGDTMTGNLIVGASIQANLFQGNGAGLTNLTGVALLNQSNYFTGGNEFTNTTMFDKMSYMTDIQLSSDTPSIIAYNANGYHNTLFYPGIEINLAPGYAYNWITASTTALTAYYYTTALGYHSRFNFDQYGLVISSGIRAGASGVDGSGGVNIIGPDGRIPALNSTYFANMDGSAITGLSTNDTTKLPLGGGTMTGSLIMAPTAISTGNIVFQGAYPHSVQFNNASGASDQFLGEVQFSQNGTAKQRILSFGDTNATYPQGLLIGADTTGPGTNIRITGSSAQTPDLVVSSWTSVGINTASPNAAYKLDVNGNLNASAFYQNGVLFTGGSGGDNLGNHIATMTITAGYGISASTISISSNVFIVGFSSANAYYGDGSHLTGVIASGGYAMLAATQTWTGGNNYTHTPTVNNIPIGGGPVGTLIMYVSTIPPAGYLYCDGTSYSTTTYSALFAVIGYHYGGSGASFTCDFRGMFARGLDTTGTIDSQYRVIGSTETDTFEKHWHVGRATDGTLINTDFTATGTTTNRVLRAGGSDQMRAAEPITDGVYPLRTGPETRPKNIAVAYMIKYAP